MFIMIADLLNTPILDTQHRMSAAHNSLMKMVDMAEDV